MVGFYDSGVGGLTILQEVLKLQPNFSYIYYADTEAMPLGDKSVEFIRNKVKEACIQLFAQGCDVVVLACNTASVVTIRHIQQVWLKENYPKKQVLSITKPLLELSENELELYKNRPGILLSTNATHDAGFYQYELILNGFVNCKSLPMPGLADAIEKSENALISNIIEQKIKSQKLDPQKIEYIILACTHYKWALDEIQNIFPKAKIVEPSQIVASKLLDYLSRHPEFSTNKKLESKFIVTGEEDNFNIFFERLGIAIAN
jgi:glutamate racemase